MALVKNAAFRRRGIAALAACLMLGACAQLPKPGAKDMLALSDKSGQVNDAGQMRSELEKATAYWGQEYANSPRDLQKGLNYARNLKAMGEKQRSLAVMQQLSLFHGQSRELASEYGRLALDLDQVNVAGRLLAVADDPAQPDWRVISARGTVLAKQGKYAEAIPFYERALTLAHDQPSILSNLALAHAMNGEPARAEAMLRQAASTDRNSLKIRQNLALVLGLQGKYDEAKLLASQDLPAEKAAENTDYLRRIVKLEPNAPPTSKAKVKLAQGAARPKPPTASAVAAEGAAAEPETETETDTDAETSDAPAAEPEQVVELPVRKTDMAVSGYGAEDEPQNVPEPGSAAQVAQRSSSEKRSSEASAGDASWAPQVALSKAPRAHER
jgi:Flp pilus assembly protein TadD